MAAIKQSLELKLGQRLAMTPQLQQAIRLLQLSALDLRTEISEALESNPLLEEEATSSQPATEVVATAEHNPATDALLEGKPTDVQMASEAPADPGVAAQEWEGPADSLIAPGVRKNTDRNTVFELDARNSSPTTLKDHLLWQVQMTGFSVPQRQIAGYIIDSINKNGYLDCELATITTMLGEDGLQVSDDQVLEVLKILQHFDPPGVAARDLQECLLLQLELLPEKTPGLASCRQLINHHLSTLAARQYKKIKQQLGIKTEGLQQLIGLLQSLQPRPGALFNTVNTQYITPDVTTRKKNGVWRAELNNEIAPRLKIHQQYKELIQRGDNTDTNRYLQHQLQEARWFIKSVENRNDTLLRVSQEIVDHQQQFFEHGEEAMQPLVLRTLADALELHESTISRATTQKYMHTPQGVFELKFFFSSHVTTANGGTRSATAIRALIRRMIADEAADQPLSDHHITGLLAEQGIKIARRTVAKYRESMHIPPSNQRTSP